MNAPVIEHLVKRHNPGSGAEDSSCNSTIGAAPSVLPGEAAIPTVRRAAMTGPGLSIRPARESDLPDLLAMIRELAAFENLEDQLQVTAAALREALFGPHPAAAALLAIYATEPVGYAIYYHTFSSFAGRPGVFLDDLYVRPAFRQHGAGRLLLERVAAIGLERNCGRFEWIALRWNENALRFYQRLGATVLDDWVMLRVGEQGLKQLARGKEGAPAQVPGTSLPP